ncbi:ATP-dependent DNA ligase [Isoptericola sp. NEAU-Y5]|uniref:ATP-dependent DNA ligase n=1 Tax=Isoptericola luteus TaxID=2879484 RepID=A0ABS7ZGK7_9MICO|nr:ATP-dependent DNA ligase [Isoptericola sp. NEAU-Y5]MCA5894043.1 ATP-dependent DNA ligase [Isoptericola sp. NEAU-Y5]
MTLPLSPPVLPMLAKSVAAVPEQPDDGPGWVYEPKWDGFRAVVFRDGDDVRIDSRNSRPMQRYFPEVVEAVKAALPERCVVDGEIVLARPGADGGAAHLDFDALGQRIHPAASRVGLLAQETPASLVVFDLLALDDDDLTSRPLTERLTLLDGLGLRGPQVHATPRTTDAEVARDWFETFEGAGLDGVVAKPADAPYQPNKRAMLKIKHARTADVVLAGFRLHKTSTSERPLVGSLLLGLYRDEPDREDGAVGPQLQFVGVAASFPAARRAALHAELSPLAVEPGTPEGAEHPWADWQDPAVADGSAGERRPGAQSRWSAGKDLTFTPLRIERVLEVGYDHMEGARFRHTAQFKRWRPDRDPGSCTYEQLAEPVGYDLGSLLPGAPGTA